MSDTTSLDSLILASTSPYRRALLEARGLPFKAIAPLCDEDALKDPLLSSEALTLKLARAKAESLVSLYPQSFIVGSDQVLDYEGQIFGKPKTPERALEQLTLLQGQSHQLVTSLYVYSPQHSWSHTETVTLTMHSWTTSQLQQYLTLDQPLDCAGSYKLEKRGLILFREIHAHDYESIIGLPLLKLFSILKDAGFPFFNS